MSEQKSEQKSDRWKRNLLVFLGGQTVSSLGSMIVGYAVMWHLTVETGSAAVLTLSVAAGMLPQAVVSVFGGVWADRHSRKLLIIGADSTIAVATLVLALLMLSGVGDLWMIFVAMAVRSALAGIQGPAVNAMLPQIVPAEHLMRVNGVQQTIQSGMMLFAPAVAAAVYASTGIVAVFFIDVVTAVAGVLLLLLVPAATVLQEQVEDAMRGRVFGFYGIVMSVSMPVSMIVFGPLADRFAVESVMVLAGVLLLGCLVGMLALGAARRPLATVGENDDRDELLVSRG
ncbi:MFS transporter [Nocardioides sp. NPDC047086]|uniref:MFS transporter n=1 Tax=Nocardioides sp. NPDC047086 TaxID=3154810 RepID=UPI00340CBD47